MSKDKHALVAGLFIIVLVTATVIAIHWIGNFDRERNTYVVSSRGTVSGLNPESTVFYRGIAVGKVIKIFFDPNDSKVILIPIEVDTNIQLTQDVYATLRLKGVTGLTQIEIKNAGHNDELLPTGINLEHTIPLLPSITDKFMLSGEDIMHKVDQLLTSINRLLTEENSSHIVGILANLKEVSDRLAGMQDRADKALIGLPELRADAHKTLNNIEGLTMELRAETPKIGELLGELKATVIQVKRVATMLDNNPQALLLGKQRPEPGPGEPGYEAP